MNPGKPGLRSAQQWRVDELRVVSGEGEGFGCRVSGVRSSLVVDFVAPISDHDRTSLAGVTSDWPLFTTHFLIRDCY